MRMAEEENEQSEVNQEQVSGNVSAATGNSAENITGDLEAES